MVSMFTKVCLLLLLIQNTFAVSLDYDKVEDDDELLNVPETSAPDEGIKTTKNEGDSLYHDKSRRSTIESRKLFDKVKIFKSTLPTTVSTVRPTHTTIKTAVSEFPFDMFLDYDYGNYDTDIKRRNKSQPKKPSTTKPALRTIKPISKLNATVEINADSNSINTTVSEDYDNYDIFHLEPSVNQLSTNNRLSFYAEEDANTWYVPEIYPCWELPLIYGQPEKTKGTSEIFLLHPLKLKNVRIDSDVDDQIIIKESPGHIFESDRYNIWCGMAPCYGDHTLCLYPSIEYSKICLNGYKVRIPSMPEQKALIMKLNSMRNRVAKGSQNEYPFLPPASNMQQITYDNDLESMTKRWLMQCLPGPPPCQALENDIVTQLECTKHIDLCCKDVDQTAKCVPNEDCFLNPIIGCLHAWFWDSRLDMTTNDVKCGLIDVTFYKLAQLLWAKTNKVGCAYGEETDGTVRVICTFAPGARFSIETKYFCGFMPLADNRHLLQVDDVTDNDYLYQMFNIALTKQHSKKAKQVYREHKQSEGTVTAPPKKYNWGVEILRNMYNENWAKMKMNNFTNGTLGMTARLVTRYTFSETSGSKCDANEPIYEVGEPGASCVETGRTFYALCYEFRDSTPGYRLVAIGASVVLFSLILVDMFRGVIRETHID